MQLAFETAVTLQRAIDKKKKRRKKKKTSNVPRAKRKIYAVRKEIHVENVNFFVKVPCESSSVPRNERREVIKRARAPNA